MSNLNELIADHNNQLTLLDYNIDLDFKNKFKQTFEDKNNILQNGLKINFLYTSFSASQMNYFSEIIRDALILPEDFSILLGGGLHDGVGVNNFIVNLSEALFLPRNCSLFFAGPAIKDDLGCEIGNFISRAHLPSGLNMTFNRHLLTSRFIKVLSQAFINRRDLPDGITIAFKDGVIPINSHAVRYLSGMLDSSSPDRSNFKVILVGKEITKECVNLLINAYNLSNNEKGISFILDFKNIDSEFIAELDRNTNARVIFSEDGKLSISASLGGSEIINDSRAVQYQDILDGGETLDHDESVSFDDLDTSEEVLEEKNEDLDSIEASVESGPSIDEDYFFSHNLTEDQFNTLKALLHKADAIATRQDLAALEMKLSDSDERIKEKEEAFILQSPELKRYYKIFLFLFVRTHFVFLMLDDGRFVKSRTGDLALASIGNAFSAALSNIPGISTVTAILETISGDVLDTLEREKYLHKLLRLALLSSEMEHLAKNLALKVTIALRDDILMRLPDKPKGVLEYLGDLWSQSRQDIISNSIAPSSVMKSDDDIAQEGFLDAVGTLTALFDQSNEVVIGISEQNDLALTVDFLYELCLEKRRQRKGEANVNPLSPLTEEALDALLVSEAGLQNIDLSSEMLSFQESHHDIHQLIEHVNSLSLSVTEIKRNIQAHSEPEFGHFVRKKLHKLEVRVNKMEDSLQGLDMESNGNFGGGQILLCKNSVKGQRNPYVSEPVEQEKKIAGLEDRMHMLSQKVAELGELQKDVDDGIVHGLMQEVETLRRTQESLVGLLDKQMEGLRESLIYYIVAIDHLHEEIASQNPMTQFFYKNTIADKLRALEAMKASLMEPSGLRLSLFNSIKIESPRVDASFCHNGNVFVLFSRVETFVSTNLPGLIGMEDVSESELDFPTLT